jgi:hypothetical protein
MIANTGSWLDKRHVLLSPNSLKLPNWQEKIFPVNLTKEQVEKSPDITRGKPVSRQNEMELAAYYQWPMYWDPGMAYVPMAGYMLNNPVVEREQDEQTLAAARKDNPNLRSCKEAIDYYIQTLDKEIGHVEDFLLDDETWRIRYIEVNTRNWLPGGKRVLVSPLWINKIDWIESKVFVDLPFHLIKEAPEYDPSVVISREYEENLFKHYTKEKYWR